jgi:hypothetical protein
MPCRKSSRRLWSDSLIEGGVLVVGVILVQVVILAKGRNMTTRRKPVLAITVVLLASALGGRVAAQDGGDSGAANDRTLVLLSVDDTRPALFQALAPGDDPVATNFETRLDVPLDGDQTQNVIYVAIENRGWSVGAVGLIGGELDPDETYIALELWERMGKLVLRDDGQGMIFPLEYVDDLDGNETPGFRLDIVIDQGRTFRIYRGVEDDGLFIWGRTLRLEGQVPDSELASHLVAPEPVFGDVLFDFHIIALPKPLPTRTPPPTPETAAEPLTLTPTLAP